MRRVRPLLFALCLAAPFGGAVALADDGPGCHGSNEAECRPDPNEHGQDCDEHGQHGESNDDHCATTTTAAVETPLVTASTAAPTTTTVAPTTTTLAMTPLEPVTTTTLKAAVLGTQVERLPATGIPVAFLLVCAALAIFFGLALRYINKLDG